MLIPQPAQRGVDHGRFGPGPHVVARDLTVDTLDEAPQGDELAEWNQLHLVVAVDEIAAGVEHGREVEVGIAFEAALEEAGHHNPRRAR